MEYRCVKYGLRIKTLFVQYSPGNVRLVKCENCRAVADDYIECEIMILLIDLILHKPQAYRHLLYNVINRETVNLEDLLWKSTIGFILLDASSRFCLNTSAGVSRYVSIPRVSHSEKPTDTPSFPGAANSTSCKL